jgi:hypothetical protein
LSGLKDGCQNGDQQVLEKIHAKKGTDHNVRGFLKVFQEL